MGMIKQMDIKILIILVLVFSSFRFYKCRYTGKKDVNPISSCSSNPAWATYGYKLSLGLVFNIIQILLLIHLVQK